MAMASPSPSLIALIAFRNLIFPELIRTVHVYRLEGGVMKVEREYVFHRESDYEENSFYKVSTLKKFEVSKHFKGLVNGVWVCIYVFDAACACSSPADLDPFPTILTVSRNRKLDSVPSLANDLQMITQLSRGVEKSTHREIGSKEKEKENHHMCDVDLNSLPCALSESDQSPAGKKKRKNTDSLALEDVAKYFGVPIVEASKNLKVGLTMLKKKCREFGIPRWPHRKIKSLDTLIYNLQKEVRRQEGAAAAVMVARRQRMLEREKQTIERQPFVEIRRETKKLRQNVFKKRHRARVLESQCRTTLSLF